MAKEPLATLLTDFGWRDPYVGAMKGAILSVCPRASIVDISHELAAGDVMAAAFVLAHSAPMFPTDTVHVVVVDPGVGTDRPILAARFAGHVFLFPDNGVITMIADRLPMEALFSVRSADLVPPGSISMTFHGRDIFAPVAGRILNGLDLRKLGPQPDTYKTLDIPGPLPEGQGLTGQVLYVDRFGNLVSNIPWELVRQTFGDPETVTVHCHRRQIGTIQGTYGFVDRGEPLALVNSMSLVEIAVNGGRADDVLSAGVGAQVRLVGALREG